MKEIAKMSTKTLFLAIAVGLMTGIAAKLAAVSTGTPTIAWTLGSTVVFGILYEGAKKIQEHRRLMKEPRVGTFRTTLEQREWERARLRNANRR